MIMNYPDGPQIQLQVSLQETQEGVLKDKGRTLPLGEHHVKWRQRTGAM